MTKTPALSWRVVAARKTSGANVVGINRLFGERLLAIHGNSHHWRFSGEVLMVSIGPPFYSVGLSVILHV